MTLPHDSRDDCTEVSDLFARMLPMLIRFTVVVTFCALDQHLTFALYIAPAIVVVPLP